MFNLVLIIGGILVVAVAITLFRVSSLLNVAEGKDKAVDKQGNRVNAALMLLFLIASAVGVVWYSYTRFDLYDLPLASEHGAETDYLFWVTMVITGIVFVITQVLLFWYGFRYQYKEDRKAYFFPHNNKLELIWTIVPAIALTLLVVTGLMTWNEITGEAPDDSEVIEIMGYQFAWGTRYPGADGELGDYDYRKIDAVNSFGMDLTDKNSHDDFMPLEMHIPKGKPVLLKIRARDVLHSVFLPHFRVKMDAVPGMPTKFWFTATKSTEDMRRETGNPDFNYELACTEICGRGHFSMRLIVVVDEPADYEKWKAEQATFLSLNPDYLAKVPEEMRELAMVSAGITKD